MTTSPTTPSPAPVLTTGPGQWAASRARVADQLDNTLVLAFVGLASCGKDSAIQALFGVDLGNKDPLPGSTSAVQAFPLDASGRVFVVNAPGFGDLREAVTQDTAAVLSKVDLAVYIVNADGGATRDVLRTLQEMRDGGRPVLVCVNKIDLIQPSEREQYLTATLEQLGVPRSDAIATAFDPLPALAEAPIGTDDVARWIGQTLAKDGKAMLFAKHIRNRAVACEPLIRKGMKLAAAAGALPVPGVDTTAITVIQMHMISEIAAVFEVEITEDVAMFILGEMLAGAGRGFTKWAVAALKAAGWVPGGQIGTALSMSLGASIASASTYGVGHATIAYMTRVKRGEPSPHSNLLELYDRFALSWRDAESPAEDGS